MDRGTFLSGAGVGIPAASGPGAANAAEDFASHHDIPAAEHPSADIVFPPLPYAENALEPYISGVTISFHCGKHHAGYVTQLEAALEGAEGVGVALEEIIRAADRRGIAKVFNLSAQVFNRAFYWHGMTPRGGGAPKGDLAARIDSAFGGTDGFRKQFAAKNLQAA